MHPHSMQQINAMPMTAAMPHHQMQMHIIPGQGAFSAIQIQQLFK